MILIRPPLVVILAHLNFILFAYYSVYAAPQNMTVDDAVLVGAVIPQYLPSTSSWNIGNNCSKCLVKPVPSKAYNGTWHDTTFNPDSETSQRIAFTFEGSALYIFFILANTVPHQGVATLTDIDLYMDNINVGTYIHSPTTSTDYQYNVLVYVNESVTPGPHSMMIVPVNTTGASILLLFDYLIYTTDTDNGTTPSVSPPAPSSSPTPPGTQGTTSRQNTAAIVGGTVGGVAGLVLVTALLLCYRRRQRRSVKRGKLSMLDERPVLESFPSLHDGPPMPLQRTSRPLRQVAPIYTPSNWETIYNTESLGTSRSASPPISIYPPSTASLLGGSNGLRQQVEQLRAEISRLRYLQYQTRNPIGFGPKATSMSKG